LTLHHEPTLPGFETPAKRLAGHHCHALACTTSVPPSMHMCRRHWADVPRPLQRALWAVYRPGQELDKHPSAAYLRAATACIEAVARAEGHSEDHIAHEVALYTEWADLIDRTEAP
jgi:diadenosine tetraphosphatase ApaH/serine/threonine PP2A family protein phosphatase